MIVFLMVMLEMIGTTFANVTGEPLVKAAKTEAQMILDAHNKVRKAAKAVAMNKLNWNEELAANAALHAKTCKIGPSSEEQRTNIGRFYSVGENYFFAFGNGKAPNYNGAIKAWASEGSGYDSRTRSCSAGRSCHNYTEMVWSTTESVGCASAKCDISNGKRPKSAHFVVCQYGRVGNRTEDEPPFVRAASAKQACTQCPKGMVCIHKEALCGHPEASNLLPAHAGGPNEAFVKEKETGIDTIDERDNFRA